MARRLWRATLAGLAFAAAAVALGRAISGGLPLPSRSPAVLAPAMVMAAMLVPADPRFTRRVGYGTPALPLMALIALLALATLDRLAGAWTEMGLASMAYQAIGLASAGLGIFYGRRYGITGGYALAAVGGCWLTAFPAIGWSLAVIDAVVLVRLVAEAALAMAAGGLAGWLVGYGVGVRRTAAGAAIRPRP